ncbi:hypothetical protein HOLleu_40488 [Holothuria leucospilota]|uniref:Uncharacterized protein n=1 Tax=Holothuria leucospilota TaxID=206669 RepID=A0A9Q0YFW1_HOLLE|nr:hypothetical protein HOLleu_40488 [Holothuria leucospilota]
MDFSFLSNLLDNIICLMIFFVVDYFVGLLCQRLPSPVRFLNWREILKNSIPSNRCTCEQSPRIGPRKSRRRQKKCKRSKKGQVTWQALTQVILSLIQEDSPQEDGADHISDRNTGGATQPPTDVKNDCSSSDIDPCINNKLQEKVQAELSQTKLVTESGFRKDGPEILLAEEGIGPVNNNGFQEKSQAELPKKNLLTEGVITGQGGLGAMEISLAQEDKKKTKQLKKKGWISKKKDLKSPWAEWKKTVPELKTLVQKLEKNKKIYSYQLGTSITVGKSPEDGNTSANREPAAPTLPDNKDGNLNNLPKEQSDKNGSTSEQASEVSCSDIKTTEESDGDKTTSESADEKEIPPDVLRISLVETIYESKAVITGKPTKADKKVASPYQGREPFRTRASTRTPTASSFRQQRSPAEWQVTVVHKKTLGHKRKNFQLISGPPNNKPATPEVLLPHENILKSCKLPITSVSEGQLKEPGPSSPETATNKTRVEDVSGKCDKDVICAEYTKCDETTSKNNVPAQSSPSSDVPSSLEPNADLLERRRLAKIGRKQRARIRKKIAQEAAQTAIKLRQRLITTDDGEIVISRDQEDWAEEIGLPFSIANSYLHLKYSQTTKT